MKQPIILRIFKDKKLLEVKQFEQDQIILGKSDDVNVKLDDEGVSAIHGLIELRESGFYICDLGSSGGTFKNDQQVLDEPISSGDRLKMGPFEIHFFVGVPRPTAPPLDPAVPVTEAPKKPMEPPVAEKKAPAAPPAAKAKQPDLPKAIPAPDAKPKQKVVEKEKNAGGKASLPSASHAKNVTFAPNDQIKVKSDIKPLKGPHVEVIVAWQNRILGTYRCERGHKLFIGDQLGDIFIPSGFVRGRIPLLDVGATCRVSMPSGARVELVDSTKVITGSAYELEQGELLCISFDLGLLQLFIRFTPETTKPIMAPFFDLTAAESTGFVIALVIAALTTLYMAVYTPPPPDEKKEEDKVRIAQFIYNKPKPTPEPEATPKVEKVAEKQPEPPKPTPTPKVIKVTEDKNEHKVGKKDSKATATERPTTKAAEVQPIPTKVNRPKKFTSTHSGGAVQTTTVEGSSMKTEKDVSKMGLFSALSGGGTRKELDKASAGAGDVIGAANQANGHAGQAEDRAGDDIGSKFRSTGAGGKGTATQGISGVGTQSGRGQGKYGNLGTSGKGSVAIDVGGTEAAFQGTIDKEAVRRVVRSKLNEIKNCYERQLNLDRGLAGKVVITFIIEEQGRVRIASTKSTTLNNRNVEECVAARIKNAIFPEPPPGTQAEVDYPFVFGSQD